MNSREDKGSKESFSRRDALKIIAGSAGAAVSLPILAAGVPACAIGPRAAEAATAPYAARFFTLSEIKTVDALAETIIPADDHSPGAHAAQVYAYIDTIVAESGASRKSEWREGLAAVDRLAESACGKKFADAGASEQIAVLERLASHEDHPETPEERFFVTVKRATIEGYYTSAIGIHQDLEYQGNTALADFPGCERAEHPSE